MYLNGWCDSVSRLHHLLLLTHSKGGTALFQKLDLLRRALAPQCSIAMRIPRKYVQHGSVLLLRFDLILQERPGGVDILQRRQLGRKGHPFGVEQGVCRKLLGVHKRHIKPAPMQPRAASHTLLTPVASPAFQPSQECEARMLCEEMMKDRDEQRGNEISYQAIRWEKMMLKSRAFCKKCSWIHIT